MIDYVVKAVQWKSEIFASIFWVLKFLIHVKNIGLQIFYAL